MKKEKSKNITIDMLAAMMQENFLATGKKITEGFEKATTKEQVEKIDERLQVIEKKLSDSNVDGIPAKIRKLEDSLEID